MNKIDEANEEEDVILFIEFKYCTVCHLEQVTQLKVNYFSR